MVTVSMVKSHSSITMRSERLARLSGSRVDITIASHQAFHLFSFYFLKHSKRDLQKMKYQDSCKLYTDLAIEFCAP